MIAGIIARKPGSRSLNAYEDVLVQSLNQFGQANSTGSWCGSSAILCGTLRYNTPESHLDSVPYTGDDGKTMVLFWGRLTNRLELLGLLDLQGDPAEVCDSALMYAGWKRWGKAVTDHIYGDFSIVIYESDTGNLFCCSDHMGVKPLYYYMDDSFFVFSSTLASFHHLDFITLKPRIEWVLRYIFHSSMDFTDTPYRSVRKLPPAHLLTLDAGPGKDSSPCISRYFSFRQDYHIPDSFDDCLQQYRELLDNAVASRVRSGYRLGAETSGGIDSSTVLALAAQQYPGKRDDIFTYGFANCDFEPDFILETSQRYNLPHNYIYCARPEMGNVVIDHSLEVMGYPYEHGNSVSHTPFYVEGMRNSIRTLLSGFGGDEFVTTIHGNIILRELLADRKLRAAFQAVTGNTVTAPLRLLKHYLTAGKRVNKSNPHMLKAFTTRWRMHPVREKFIDEYRMKEVFFRPAAFDAGYTNLNRFTLENRLAPFIPTRMNNCTLMAESYGIAYAWPLLDVRLIEFFLSVPAEYKLRKFGRYFHRKAVEDAVPAKVIWKRGKDMGSPPAGFTAQLDIVLDDLHPDLRALLDIDRFRTLLDTRNNLTKIENMALFRYSSAINTVNRWLYMYHPDGFDWQPEELG